METSRSISAPAFWSERNLDLQNAALREKASSRSRARLAIVPRAQVPESSREVSEWTLSPGRRIVDFCFAAAALTLSMPLFVMIAVAVRLSSSGPVIFRQGRVGRFGNMFVIYKFRTMEEAEAQRSGPSVTRCGDCRITPVGSILRRFKLDELPQLVNVLYGDMSLVGPRPKLPHHQKNDLEVPFRPGLTGAATLVFRREEELLKHVPDHELEQFCLHTLTPYKAKLDFEYASVATLGSDLRLLCRTAQLCLRRSEEDLSNHLTLV